MFQKKYLLFLLSSVLVGNKAVAQDWVTKMQDPSVNFYDVQQSFNNYWKKEERKEKLKSFFAFSNKSEVENEGYLLYKRWEDYVAPRVAPTGDRSVMKAGNLEIEKLISSHHYKSVMQTGGNWSPMGAFNIPTGGGGAGRLNCVRFHPTNQNIIYVGSPCGGLWTSMDAGATWSTNTDALPALGITDIAIDATSTNVMYVATGDEDASDTHSIGILKSIDAGATWNMTGLNWTVLQGRKVSRILINPNDHTMLFAGSDIGVFKSTDAGVTWIKTSTIGDVKDMEFKPGDPNVVYFVSASGFYRSTNSGNNFTQINAGLPSGTTVSRMAIAVTPDDPSYLYLVCSANSNSAFGGLYLSTNSGISFALQSDYPNLLGWDSNGNDSGGQGWYTLSIAASPTNKYEVIVGGVNIWKSYDAGVNWYLSAHWYGAGAPYVHADIHDLIFRPDGSAYFAACDGGIFETTNGGASWQDRSAGLQIGQMYRLGGAATDASLVLQGWQDNGTNLYTNGTWNYVMGGDGMECFIDWSNANYMYGELYNGAFNRSSDGGSTFYNITNGITEAGAWVTPWLQDPLTPTTIYSGFANVWKSTDRGDNWSVISDFGSMDVLKCLAVAPSNPNYIFASDGMTIYKTTDGGTSWSNFTIPETSGNNITYLSICTTNPNTIWASISGYSANAKVFKSTDGGTSWINLSAGLPNLPVNCIVNQTGTDDGVYVGTDVGVYYIDNQKSSFMPFSNGLPNVVVDELEIHYGSNKLRAATYGRGLWETPIYDPASTLPFANFYADTLSGCPGFTVQFSDSTKNAPTAWNWSFPGGTPSTSTLQNPLITYANPGTYNNVKLIVSNNSGIDSVIKNSYIAVSPQTPPVISIINGNDSVCIGTVVTLKVSQAESYLWSPGGQTFYLKNVNSTGVYSVTTTDVFGCVSTSAPLHIYVFAKPQIPSITANGDTLTSSSTWGNHWYNYGYPIANATAQTYVMPSYGIYRVIVKDTVLGCSSTSSNYVGIDEIFTNGIRFSIYPNPTKGIATFFLESNSSSDLRIEITDVLGKIVYEKQYPSFTGSLENTIDLSSYGQGVYLLSIINDKGTALKKIVVY